MSEEPLAALVDKRDGDETIESLREEGVYDDSRRVREYDDERIAIPVTAPPDDAVAVDEVAEQPDPDYRRSGLADRLRERGWSDAEIESAPASWAVIGSVVLANFDGCPRPLEVGDALLSVHGEADTVLDRDGIDGDRREPSVRIVAGEGDTETVHVEHGTKYALDLAEVMFSPGNKAERTRMGEIVADADGERVFDMFAGIGYFTLPMARAGARVTAAEINPTAYRYLVENAVLNGVQDRIDAFRADCRDVDATADRVVMGYYDAHEYLDAALAALEPGGTIHMHEATPEVLLWDRPVERLRTAAEARGRAVEIVDRRIVKSHSEGVEHVVVDARVDEA